MTGLLVLLLAFGLVGCQSPSQRIYTSSIFAMDTIMELEIAGKEDYTLQAEEMIRDLEKDLSVTDENSEIYSLNEYGVGQVSSRLDDIMQRTLKVCERTDGALDITIYPVLKAWGFTTGQYRVPSDDELQELVNNVDYSRIRTDYNGDHLATITIPYECMVDLGSVAKGYTGTYVADQLKEMGVEHALLNLGGNVQCIGTKPNGEKWKVAIKSPFEDSKTGVFGVVAADDVAIITSGGYERYFEEDGEIYWHILDPMTGKPAKSGLASVTVVGKDGLVCDGMSTALFVKGLDEAIEIWRDSDDFEAVFVTETGEVYVTNGLAEDFTLTSEYHDAPLQILVK